MVGVRVGLARAVAEKLVLQTIFGSVRLAMSTASTPPLCGPWSPLPGDKPSGLHGWSGRVPGYHGRGRGGHLPLSGMRLLAAEREVYDWLVGIPAMEVLRQG